MAKQGAYKPRAGQLEFERGMERHRVVAQLARRQYGKTTGAARISLKKMLKRAGHTVVFGSVKLDLGREIVRKESEVMRQALLTLSGEDGLLRVAADGRELASSREQIEGFKADDFAELYEAQRLEFRLYHSRSVYSRTKVVALTPAAVGETGDLILDEVGRVKNFREVWEAVKPIIASNPEFRCLLTTTPPPDDTHYSFELLSPPIGEELAVNPKGNWYRSDLGVWVLRITAWDAYADGIPLYDDDSGAAISPEVARGKEHDKDAWDRNYGCKFVIGGTAACGLLQLDTAQRRSLNSGNGALGETRPTPSCRFFQVGSDLDFEVGLKWLISALGAGRVGIGWDLATTTKLTSNPSGVVVVEEDGVDSLVVGVFAWKVSDPDVAMERMRRIVEGVRQRRAGGGARRVCVDATNERYFAQLVRKELAGLAPVELVIGSETIERPGMDEPITMKQFLGGILVAELDDNRLTLPAERYVREDWRLVKKEKGQFVCEPDAGGRHGDTFDGAKLALWALRSNAGALTTVEGIRTGGGGGRGKGFRPMRLRG